MMSVGTGAFSVVAGVGLGDNVILSSSSWCNIGYTFYFFFSDHYAKSVRMDCFRGVTVSARHITYDSPDISRFEGGNLHRNAHFLLFISKTNENLFKVI